MSVDYFLTQVARLARSLARSLLARLARARVVCRPSLVRALTYIPLRANKRWVGVFFNFSTLLVCSTLWMTLLLYMVVLYGSVLTSALLTERYNRCLFNIHCALSDQREALVNERDATRYVGWPAVHSSVLPRRVSNCPSLVASLSHLLDGSLPPFARAYRCVQLFFRSVVAPSSC